MKETRWGLAMLDIYEANGEWIFSDLCDEGLSRWCCRCSDEPNDDATSEADWMINSRHLRAFLTQHDDALIKSNRRMHNSELKENYSISEISSFVVYDDGAIALFKRSDDGEFLCQQMYASGRHIPQSFWEAMYPNIRERALAKIRDVFFSDNVPIWYFVGEIGGLVYRVTPDKVAICTDVFDADGEDATSSEGVRDGLDSDPNYFHEAGGDCCFAYFDPEALRGTTYLQDKLDTPESLLAASKRFCDIEWLLRDAYLGVLTDEEYFRSING